MGLGKKSEENVVKTEGTRKGHLSGLKKAKKTFEDKITAKKKAEDEFRRKQEEKEAAVKKYKEKKAQKNKALRAKTKRGQPVLAGKWNCCWRRYKNSAVN